jgi:hypothetical protein
MIKFISVIAVAQAAQLVDVEPSCTLESYIKAG